MDRKAIKLQRKSPQFSHLISWLKEEKLDKLLQFFPLEDMDTWIRRKYRSRLSSRIDLVKLKDEIYRELIDPLFIKPAINIKYEDNPREHRRDNLFCCFEVLLRDLKRIKKEELYNKFENTLRGFRLDYKKIVPSVNFPFSWMLESKKLIPEEMTTYRLKQELEKLNEKMGKIDKARDEIMDCFLEDSFFTKEWRKKHTEIKEVEIKIDRRKKRGYILSDKLDQTIKLSERILNWLKIARGKSGCHPKAFNVFVYHVMNKNKCTYWKFDENHKPVFHKIGERKGQHKLERDWKLILFLILYFYLRLEDKDQIPWLKEFISKNGRKPAHEALKILKEEKLRNIYKNFPPKEGWPFLRKVDETGFRKLIVNDNGGFQIVSL